MKTPWSTTASCFKTSTESNTITTSQIQTMKSSRGREVTSNVAAAILSIVHSYSLKASMEWERMIKWPICKLRSQSSRRICRGSSSLSRIFSMSWKSKMRNRVSWWWRTKGWRRRLGNRRRRWKGCKIELRNMCRKRRVLQSKLSNDLMGTKMLLTPKSRRSSNFGELRHP